MIINTINKNLNGREIVCPMVIRLTPPPIIEVNHLSAKKVNLLGCYSLFKLCRYISRNVFSCIKDLTIVFLNEGGREQEPAIALEIFREMGKDILVRTITEIKLLVKAFEFDGVLAWECEPFIIIRELTFNLPEQIQNAFNIGDGLDPKSEVKEMMDRLIRLNKIYLQLKEKLIEYRKEAKERIVGNAFYDEDPQCVRVKHQQEIRLTN